MTEHIANDMNQFDLIETGLYFKQLLSNGIMMMCDYLDDQPYRFKLRLSENQGCIDVNWIALDTKQIHTQQVDISNAVIMCLIVYLSTQENINMADIQKEYNSTDLNVDPEYQSIIYPCLRMLHVDNPDHSLTDSDIPEFYAHVKKIAEIRKKDGYDKYIKLLNECKERGFEEMYASGRETYDHKLCKFLEAIGFSKSTQTSLTNEQVAWVMFTAGFFDRVDVVKRLLPNCINSKYTSVSIIEGGLASGNRKLLELLATTNIFNSMSRDDWKLILRYPFQCEILLELINHDTNIIKRIIDILIDNSVCNSKILTKELAQTRLEQLINKFCSTKAGIDLLHEYVYLFSTEQINRIMSNSDVPAEYKIDKFPIYRSLNKTIDIYRSIAIFELCNTKDIKIQEDDPLWDVKFAIFNEESHYLKDTTDIISEILSIVGYNTKYSITLYHYGKTIIDVHGYEHPVKIDRITNVRLCTFSDRDKTAILSGRFASKNGITMRFQLETTPQLGLSGINLPCYTKHDCYLKITHAKKLS